MSLGGVEMVLAGVCPGSIGREHLRSDGELLGEKRYGGGGRTIAYLRVSTAAQETNTQRLAILEFARTASMEVHEFLEIQASSRRSATVRQLDVLLSRLAPGDALIVSELSRLGRSVGEIITTVDTLTKRQIRVFALKEGLRLTGGQDLQSRVMMTLFGLFAEIERELLEKS